MTTLFEAAATNATLIMEIVEAMRKAASGAGVTFSDDPLQFVQLALQTWPLSQPCRVNCLGSQPHMD